jgi:hypothetical protein
MKYVWKKSSNTAPTDAKSFCTTLVAHPSLTATSCQEVRRLGMAVAVRTVAPCALSRSLRKHRTAALRLAHCEQVRPSTRTHARACPPRRLDIVTRKALFVQGGCCDGARGKTDQRLEHKKRSRRAVVVSTRSAGASETHRVRRSGCDGLHPPCPLPRGLRRETLSPSAADIGCFASNRNSMADSAPTANVRSPLSSDCSSDSGASIRPKLLGTVYIH